MCTIRREKYVLRFPKKKCDMCPFGGNGVEITHGDSRIRLCPAHLRSHIQQAVQPSQVGNSGTSGTLAGPVPPARLPSGASASSSWNVSLDTSFGIDMDAGANMDKLRWRPDVENSLHRRQMSGTFRTSRGKECFPSEPSRYRGPSLSMGVGGEETSFPRAGNLGRLRSRPYSPSRSRDSPPKANDFPFRSSWPCRDQLGDLHSLLPSTVKRPGARAIDGPFPYQKSFVQPSACAIPMGNLGGNPRYGRSEYRKGDKNRKIKGICGLLTPMFS